MGNTMPGTLNLTDYRPRTAGPTGFGTSYHFMMYTKIFSGDMFEDASAGRKYWMYCNGYADDIRLRNVFIWYWIIFLPTNEGRYAAGYDRIM
jgi:hypothetical protein